MGAVDPPMTQVNVNARPVASEIRRILLESLDLDPDDVKLSSVAAIHDIVAMDSVAALRFFVALESAYGVTIEEEWLSLDRLTDLDALAAYIRQKTSDAPASAGGDAGQQQVGT
jgi:acyl carrier protein